MENLVYWVRVAQKEKNRMSTFNPPLKVFENVSDAENEMNEWIKFYTKSGCVFEKDPTLDYVYYGECKHDGTKINIQIMSCPIQRERRSK